MLSVISSWFNSRIAAGLGKFFSLFLESKQQKEKENNKNQTNMYLRQQ